MKYLALLLSIAAIGLSGAALMLTHGVASPASEPAGSKVTAAYSPGLGDLMTAGVQPRHAKLWLAGSVENWPLAAYELDELEEALADVVHYQPRWEGMAIEDMVKSLTDEPIKSARDAIKAKDRMRFATAYERLTTACNACHQASGRAFIAVTAPDRSSFPDQVFAPAQGAE